MILKIQDIINRTINDLYNISHIDMRYLSDDERLSLISEYTKIMDGVHTNVCSEFDESLVNISKICSDKLKLFKTTIDKLRVYYKSSPKQPNFIKLKYNLSLKDLKKYYNKKISEITLSQLKSKSLYELYIENCRSVINDLDPSILAKHYDIYNVDDSIAALISSPSYDKNNFQSDNEIITYLTKIYMEYTTILKWCDGIIESTYQKIIEYKQYVERDIKCRYKTGCNQFYAIDICTDVIYAILFFSQIYILTENILRFYMNLIVFNIDVIITLIKDINKPIEK